MKKFFNYFSDSYHELKLVIWPKHEELVRHTVITIVFVFISAAILALVDYGLSTGYLWFLNFGG